MASSSGSKRTEKLFECSSRLVGACRVSEAATLS